MGNDTDADDATQTALISIVSALDRFDRRARFTTWAHRIAVNACLDELRRRSRRPDLTEDPALERGHALHATAPVAPESAGDRVDIDVALRQLPGEFRAAVVLRDLCGFDYAEIAEVLEIPPGTVRSRIARGRAALVPLLGNPPSAADRPKGDA